MAVSLVTGRAGIEERKHMGGRPAREDHIEY
jgi:hypothetical protein